MQSECSQWVLKYQDPRMSDPKARANLPPSITGTVSRATIILKAREDVLMSLQIRRKN